MQEVIVYDDNLIPINKLAQWDMDIGIKIKINNVASPYNVHFFNRSCDEAYVMQSTIEDNYLRTKIPNILLEKEFPIFGYIITDDNGEQRSNYSFQILMVKRPKPSDFIHSNTQDYISVTYVLKECGEYSKNAFDASNISKSYSIGGTGIRENEDTDNAKYYYQETKSNAVIAQDSLSEIVEIVSGAELSAQSAKSSEDSARTFSESAKSSENNSRTFSENANEYSKNAADHATASAKVEERVILSEERISSSLEEVIRLSSLAEQSSSNALTSELNAKSSEEIVALKSVESESNAAESKSWAIGGTGTRDGEDSDNSKFYCESVKNSYLISKSYAIGGTGTRDGEDSDNSKFYFESIKSFSESDKVTIAEIDGFFEFT